MSGPTARGRFAMLSLGVIGGTLATAYFLRDVELIRKIEEPNDNRPFRVRFEQSKPLRLKPEAQERLKQEK